MKKISFRVLFIYLILLLWGIILIKDMFSIVVTKGDAYEGNFEDTLTVDDKYFKIVHDTKQGFRGNVYSDEKELLTTTIPIYDLYWEISKVGFDEEDSIFFMSRVDSLINIFKRLTPKRSDEYYEKNVKQIYVNYYKRYNLAKLKTKAKKNEKIQKAGQQELKEITASIKNKMLPIKISVDANPSHWVRRSDWDEIRNLFAQKDDKPEKIYYGGCRVDEHYVHNNVYINYASSIIGSVGENQRYSGIDGYYDSLLSGEKKSYRKLYVNRVLVPLRENQMMQVHNGCDIVTTINIDMQRMVEQVLLERLKEIKADWGTVILMETRTGEIKAISSLTYSSGTYKDISDHAVTECYEPGSTFKLVTLLAALDSKRIDIDDTVKCEKGRFSLKRAFAISDNDGLYNAAKISYRTLQQFFMKVKMMGLDSNLELEVLHAEKPYLTNKNRSEIDYHSITHGYAVKVPPVYTLAYYNAVANNGKLVRPYLVKEVLFPSGKHIVNHTTVIKERICDPITIYKAKECLRAVVEEGTGRLWVQDSYYKQHKNDSGEVVHPLISGKTGTAQIYSGGYQIKKFNASFVGFFPGDYPKYTCLVMISGTDDDGGKVSGPVCLEIAEKIVKRDLSMRQCKDEGILLKKMPYSKYGYAPDLLRIYERMGYKVKSSDIGFWGSVKPLSGEDNTVKFTPVSLDKNLKSSLMGASAMDAVYQLEKHGYKPVVKGVGKVSDIYFQGKTAFVSLKNI